MDDQRGNRACRSVKGDFQGNIRYTTLVASDVYRDGIRLELHWHYRQQDSTVAEIFVPDKDGAWTLSTFDCDVPLEMIERLIADAKTRLTRKS
jgi:hypothetical protein